MIFATLIQFSNVEICLYIIHAVCEHQLNKISMYILWDKTLTLISECLSVIIVPLRQGCGWPTNFVLGDEDRRCYVIQWMGDLWGGVTPPCSKVWGCWDAQWGYSLRQFWRIFNSLGCIRHESINIFIYCTLRLFVIILSANVVVGGGGGHISPDCIPGDKDPSPRSYPVGPLPSWKSLPLVVGVKILVIFQLWTNMIII